MDPPVQTYVANQQVLAAELNDIQTRAAGVQPANKNNDYGTFTVIMPDGWIVREWAFHDNATVGISLATGTLAEVDSSIDWRDRIVTLMYSLGDDLPGNPDDYLINAAVTVRKGYTGLGAKATGGVNPPSAGDPPVPASEVSWAPTAATNLFVYAHPSTGALWIYNNTGSTVSLPQLTIIGTGITGRRP